MGKSRCVAKAFNVIEPDKRINPQSVRRLFHQWISAKFGRNVEAAAKELNDSRDPMARNNRRLQVQKNTFYDILNDKSQMKYFHVEAVARYHNVPIAALLLFTRTQSELENGEEEGLEKARALVSRFQAFTADLSALIEDAAATTANAERIAQRLDYAAFDRLKDHFLSDKDRQSELPLGDETDIAQRAAG